MNGWDLFTWVNCGILGVAAVFIFVFFLKDARGVLAGNRGDGDREQGRPEVDAVAEQGRPEVDVVRDRS